MSLNRRLEPLPEFETNHSDRHKTLFLAAVLIVGLTFITPTLSLISGVPALFFVVMVGLLYGALALLLRQLFTGSLVGLLVTSTFSANVPLASDAYLSSMPAHLGPTLWLAQIPLVASVVLVLLMGPRTMLAGITKIEGLFAAFVGWTVLAAVFGATAHLDTALYFSLRMFQGFIVFVLLRYAVQRVIISFDLVIEIFVGTVLAQSLFAVGQFLNRDVFGVTTLGEGDGIAVAMVSFGPLGDFAFGTHVAGFTGMSFILGSLIVLAVPIAVTLAIRESGWRRATLLGAALVMAAVLRATGTDAGRGALIVAVGCLCVALVYSNRTTLTNWMTSTSTSARSSRNTPKRAHAANAMLTVLTMLVGVVALFYPSSASGASSSVTRINDNSAIRDAGGGSGGGTDATNLQPTAIESFLQNTSIPFFDISTLGIRVKQYAAGIDLFLQHPIFGIGGANFIYYSTKYGLPDPLSIHSTYFAVLAETGFPGFALYILLLGSILWYGWKTSKRVSDGVLLVGLLYGIVGYLAFGIWDILPLITITSFFPFCVLAGTVAGNYSQRDSQQSLS